MNSMKIVNSVTEINHNHLKDKQENNKQQINEFVNEMVKKYEEKEKDDMYDKLCHAAVRGQEESYWERRMERHKKIQEHFEEMQGKRAVARRIQQERYLNKLAQQKAERRQLSSPCTEEGQLFQFSVAELIFGEGGIL